MAVQQVDLEMRVRGEELAAMEAPRSCGGSAAATDRASRVELLERVTAPRTDEDESEMPGRGGLLREIAAPETIEHSRFGGTVVVTPPRYEVER